MAARLRAAGEAYEKQTGQKAQFGEFSRGNDVQQIYYDKSKAGTGGGIAAPAGASQHQKGSAGDLPDSGFRKWLYAGNQDQYGLHFPVKGDAPHVQANPAYKGQPFSQPARIRPAVGAYGRAMAAGPGGRSTRTPGRSTSTASLRCRTSQPRSAKIEVQQLQKCSNMCGTMRLCLAFMGGNGNPAIQVTQYEKQRRRCTPTRKPAPRLRSRKMAQSPMMYPAGKTMQDM